MLASSQRADTLKYEIVCAIHPDAQPTAISSSNYHLDHFGIGFGIESANGDVAHTACVGFGVERITLALLGTHGLDPDLAASCALPPLAVNPPVSRGGGYRRVPGLSALDRQFQVAGESE